LVDYCQFFYILQSKLLLIYMLTWCSVCSYYELGIIPIWVNFYEGRRLVNSFIKLGGGGFYAPEESL